MVDGMTKVHSLDNPDWIKNCEQFAHHFNRLFSKFSGNQQIHLPLTDMVYHHPESCHTDPKTNIGSRSILSHY